MPIMPSGPAVTSGDGQEKTASSPKRRKSAHETVVVALLRRNLASLKSEVAHGTRVDPDIIAEMENAIEGYEIRDDASSADLAR